MANTKQNINGEDNNNILSYMLAQEVKQARDKQNPTAEEIINSIPMYKVVYK